ncbi:MAG TPA: HlyD family efflux transporter periplasmic adaptor subunit [Noviherbaspirillum sp.]|jgi:RND family efflux transporter MFP subunit|uniref:HlyD family efflux transporter periplasmic adaptor subunit n=1 Tax=Noviherbaspirillum sp. TaxID=1926288 RepID=UPI002F924CDF
MESSLSERSAATGAESGRAAAASEAAAWAALSSAGSIEACAAAWLRLQCGILAEVRRAVVVLGPPDTGPFVPEAFWPEGQPATPLLAEAADQAIQSHQPLTVKGDGAVALACPVLLDRHLHGLVAVELAPSGEARVQQAMRALQWGVQGLQSSLYRLQAEQEDASRERLMTTLDLVASTMTEQQFKPAANALVTELALRLDCDRVSVGFRKGLHTDIAAVSHSAQFGTRMNLIRAICTAMDEAIDQKSAIRLPLSGDEVLVTRDHAALARQHGSDAILTIPFVIGETTAGAFCFERSGERAFDRASVELCEAAVALCSRVLEEKRRNDRPLALRVRDAARDQLLKLTGPRHFGRKLAALVLMLSVLFFSFASSTYTVGADATLEGAVRRVLVAPFDGYLESAPHRAGDLVEAGTVLATLDQRELQLEYLRWASQSEQYAKQYQEALAKADRVAVNVTQAQMQQAKAQMDLLAEHLSRASVTAPFPGVVVHGDLSQALGSSVKRGQTLFEVAPLNAYRVILEVPEGEITHVRNGQAGTLMLTALPGEEFPLSVRHVSPVTVAREGRSFFRVEATVVRMSDRMRPGMEGVGKIEVGRRTLFWQWTHQMFDWMRLAFWSWV